MASPTSRLLDESRRLRSETASLCTAMDRLGAKMDELLNVLCIALGGLSNVVVKDNVMYRPNWTAWVQILHRSIPAKFRQLVIYDPTTPTGFRNITITNNTTTK